MKRYIVALDEGTTSARAAVYDVQQNRILKVVNQPFRQIYPQAGWVEHDINELYAAQIKALNEAVILSGARPAEIISIGITNQRESVVLWDEQSGEPVCNAIVWQCRRTADVCRRLRADGYSDWIHERTGLIPDAYFSATKIAWILRHCGCAGELLQKGRLRAGTIDTYLVWRLTEGRRFVTDATNASRTMLYNIHTMEWDEELLRLFGVPREILPEVIDSDACAGETNVLGCMIPIFGIAGDQQAALFGQCCFEAGKAKNTYGTGCFLLMNIGSEPAVSEKNLLTTVAYRAGGRTAYALEGSVFNAGSAVQWLRDELGVIERAEDTEQLALSVPDTGGVYVVPAFTGLGAPYWDMNARGTIVGITRGTGRAHLTRAVLEAMAYSTLDIAREMSAGCRLPMIELSCDGGGSNNDFVMQFQADLLRCRLVRPVCTEVTALGAVYLSGLGAGVFRDLEQIAALKKEESVFAPRMDESESRRLYRGWKQAVERSLNWENESE